MSSIGKRMLDLYWPTTMGDHAGGLMIVCPRCRRMTGMLGPAHEDDEGMEYITGWCNECGWTDQKRIDRDTVYIRRAVMDIAVARDVADEDD